MANAKPKAATKTEVINRLAEATELSKKQVGTFFEALTTVIKDELGKKGPGIVNIPGLLRIKRVVKAATKDRPGRNPQTGEAITIKGKPKRTVVRVLALKALKEMVK